MPERPPGPKRVRSRQPVSPYIFLRADGAIGARAAHGPSRTQSKAMLNEVYNKRIIELAGNIPRLGRLSDADASATAHSKLCGSTVTVDLKMSGDEVTDFAHDVKACALGQASSSIMASHVIGAKADELRSLRETVRKMLKENGAPPNGKWADIAVLEPVRDYKARHASTLLTFDAVVDAIGQIEARRQKQAAE
jgi:NifU-like protein involved in Fe-S cluster formation